MNNRTSISNLDAQKKKNYKNVSVSVSWRVSFESFLSDMGPAPSKFHTLDRIDNEKGYNKDNCRWATRAEQANNRTNNVEYQIDYNNNRWRVRKQVNGNRIFVGTYISRETVKILYGV